MHAPPEMDQSTMDAEATCVSDVYQTVTRLNALMHAARQLNIEVTVDVEYVHIMDEYRPHQALIRLKVAKLLNEPSAL